MTNEAVVEDGSSRITTRPKMIVARPRRPTAHQLRAQAAAHRGSPRRSPPSHGSARSEAQRQLLPSVFDLEFVHVDGLGATVLQNTQGRLLPFGRADAHPEDEAIGTCRCHW